MKRLRRLLAAALLAAFSVSLVAYGAPAGGSAQEFKAATKADREVLAKAGQKTRDLTSVEVQSAVDLKVAVNGQSAKVLMVIKTKGQDMGKRNMKYLVNTYTEAEGQSANSSAFFNNGYYYVEAGGEKSKIAVEPEDVMEVFNSNTNSDWLDNLDYFQDLKVREQRGGEKVYSFNCELSRAGSLVRQFNDEIGVEEHDMDLKMLYGTIYVNAKGYISRQTMDFKMAYESGDGDLDVDMQMEIRYTNPGKPVTVTLPSTAGY